MKAVPTINRQGATWSIQMDVRQSSCIIPTVAGASLHLTASRGYPSTILTVRYYLRFYSCLLDSTDQRESRCLPWEALICISCTGLKRAEECCWRAVFTTGGRSRLLNAAVKKYEMTGVSFLPCTHPAGICQCDGIHAGLLLQSSVTCMVSIKDASMDGQPQSTQGFRPGDQAILQLACYYWSDI